MGDGDGEEDGEVDQGHAQRRGHVAVLALLVGGRLVVEAPPVDVRLPELGALLGRGLGSADGFVLAAALEIGRAHV